MNLVDRLPGALDHIAESIEVDHACRFDPSTVPVLTAGGTSRRPFAIAAAVLGVVGIAAAGYTVTRPAFSDAPTTTTPATPSDLDLLLYPAGAGMRVESATTLSAASAGGTTVLIDSSGVTHTLRIGAAADPPDWSSRTVGGLQVWHGYEDGNAVYAVFGECSTFTVSEGEHAIDWDPSVVSLLEHVSIANGTVVVKLPVGWKDLGAGQPTATYEMTFSATVDGRSHELRLIQALGSTPGVLAAGVSPGRVTYLGGGSLVVLSTETTRYVLWRSDGAVAMLGGETDLDSTTMAAITAQLTGHHAEQWSAALDPTTTAGTSATETGAPAPSTTIASRLPVLTDPACARPTLTVEQ